MITGNLSHLKNAESFNFSPLPLQRPLLLVGHGTTDNDGRQSLLDFAQIYQDLDQSRPVIPCFLELTEPNILSGIERCINAGYTELSVLPLLLFAARHNKFDITNELDKAKIKYPQLKLHYGRHFGITSEIITLWRDRLTHLKNLTANNSDTVLLFVGRGSSDPDANSDVYKLARIVWEGSGYSTFEVCFIGITHPRLEEGFRRATFYQPKQVIVLPHFLFTGKLVKKIFDITNQQQEKYPDIQFNCLSEMGLDSQLFTILRHREIETQLGQVNMNCELCKFRIQAISNNHNHHHDHHHDHHHHDHQTTDPYANLDQYHQKIWQVP